MNEEPREQKSNVRISKALHSLEEALTSLDSVITEIETSEGLINASNPVSPIDASRSISELIKSIPSDLTEYAEKIENQIDRLRSLVL